MGKGVMKEWGRRTERNGGIFLPLFRGRTKTKVTIAKRNARRVECYRSSSFRERWIWKLKEKGGEGRGGERILSSVFLTGTWNQQRMEMGWVPQVRLPLSEGVEKFSHWICFICHALLVAVHVSGELRINMKASEGEEREKERKNTLSLFFRIDIFLETLPHLALNTYGG